METLDPCAGSQVSCRIEDRTTSDYLLGDTVTQIKEAGIRIRCTTAALRVFVLVQGMGQFMRGDGLVVLSAALYAVSAVMSKSILAAVSRRTFVLVRNLFSAVVFFGIAMVLYGPVHFADAFAVDFWLVMLVCALIIVVLGQLAWYAALDQQPPATVANWSMLSPFVGVIFAYVLLREIPGILQLAACIIIVVGMLLAKKSADTPLTEPPLQEKSLAAA